MKTNRHSFTVHILRFAVCVSALCLGLGFASVRAAGSATVNLAGAEFGRGLDVHLNSGTTVLPPAASYKYSLEGSVRFTGLLALVFPASIDIATLVDQIQPGSSAMLSGTYQNPNGTLPLRVINQTFAGSVQVPGGQTLSASVKIVAKVNAAGQVRIDVTDVDFSVTNFHLDPGTIIFDSGSLIVDAPSVIEFKSALLKVSEDVGTARLTVKPLCIGG